MKAALAFTASAGIATLLLGAVTPTQAAPLTSSTSAPKAASPNVCVDTNIRQALVGAVPGQLLAPPQDVTAASQIQGGSLFRVAYATTGEAGSVQATCGLIAVPDAPAIKGVVAWAHGTVGLNEQCQPSMNPARFVGPMYAGIGAVSANGSQQDGALYSLLQDGFAVTATDYFSAGMGSPNFQQYVLGVPSGLAVIDSARALTGNADEFGLAPVSPNAQLPLLTWGHSQGGGSALWAGQLAREYLAAMGDQTLDLAGVAAEAPASQFTTSPGQPDAYLGLHLGDRDMYNMNPGLLVNGLPIPFPIGVALFSFVTTSWSQVTDGTAGAFPFGPTQSVSYQDVLTPSGATTAPRIAALCLNASGLPGIAAAATPYLAPDLKRFFASPFGGSKSSGSWKGGIDATCDDPSSQPQAFQDWCAWLQFNMPGPNGVNPYSKIPVDNSGDKVPVYIAQGLNDRIIWCVDTEGQVQGTRCLTDQLFHSFEDEYCDGSGYLQADYFPGASHLSLPGAAATNPSTGDFDGSPLEEFIGGAMNGTLAPQCIADDADG